MYGESHLRGILLRPRPHGFRRIKLLAHLDGWRAAPGRRTAMLQWSVM